MASTARNWKVKLFEALPPHSVPAARALDIFAVQTETGSHDEAKRKAIEWLNQRNYKVRSVSFSTEGEMVAYVMPKGSK